MHHAGIRFVLLLAAAWWATPAAAQTSGRERLWEIEGYGGLMRGVGGGGGTVALPEPGAPIATSSPIFPSRRVPTWLVGDGAALLNAVNDQFGVVARLQPLDPALDGSGLDRGSIPAAGVRLRRAVGARYAVELSFDVLGGSADLSDDFQAAVEATRNSFRPAFEGLLSTGPFTDVQVDTAVSTSSGSTRELAVTGAVVYLFDPAGGFRPYVTLGGGVIAGTGDGAAVAIEGRYRFRVLGEVPFDETDRLIVRHEPGTALVGVAGAGIRRDVSDRWGIGIDGRVFMGRQATRVTLDSNPSVAQGTPADFIETFAAPAIQFSNNPSTGRESSLGVPGLTGFEAFAGDAFQARVLITAGVFVRF